MERLKTFDPQTIFSMSDESFDDEEEGKSSDLKMRKNDSVLDNRKLNETFLSAQNKAEGKGNFASQRINFYKSLIFWIDIISTILIIGSEILIQLENSNYYQINKVKRTEAIKIAKYILLEDPSLYNASLANELFNSTDFNSTLNWKDYQSVKITLDVDDFCSGLRFVILTMSVLSSKLFKSNLYSSSSDFINIL
jgi:hypothetical protein